MGQDQFSFPGGRRKWRRGTIPFLLWERVEVRVTSAADLRAARKGFQGSGFESKRKNT
jgi:hypothetical protein